MGLREYFFEKELNKNVHLLSFKIKTLFCNRATYKYYKKRFKRTAATENCCHVSRPNSKRISSTVKLHVYHEVWIVLIMQIKKENQKIR